MNFNIGFYKINHINNTSSNCFKVYNTNIKPSIGDSVKIDNEIYKVKSICVDYDQRNVHVFVD